VNLSSSRTVEVGFSVCKRRWTEVNQIVAQPLDIYAEVGLHKMPKGRM
jgi:hypothetical protein